jgi:hypothetical protein
METVLSALGVGAGAGAGAAAAQEKKEKGKGKKAGGGRKYTVDPATINDLESWLEAFGAGAVNVWKGPDNSLLVLDPAKAITDVVAAREAPVKTIAHTMAHDLSVVLGSATASEELRAAAEAKRNAYMTERGGYISGHMGTYELAEEELLTAADQWSASGAPDARRAAAYEVARKTIELDKVSRLLREAQYPYRQLNVQEGSTKDSVLLTHTLRRMAAKDRVVTLGGAAPIANANVNANY